VSASDSDRAAVAFGEIDWTTAQVADAVLTVKLSGEPSSAWAKRVGAVIELLQRDGRGWDHITVTKTQVEVTGVTEGSEPDLQHFVQGAVQQANADFAARRGNAQDTDADPGAGRDREMTDAFQALAGDTGEAAT
jgi:hypothetical protein